MSGSLRDILNESCGLAAAINIPNASERVWEMLFVQQHRGESGAGIVSSDSHNLHLHKGFGRVDVVFPEKPVSFNFKDILPGNMASGHNRYATKGSVEEICNIQPLVYKETKYDQWAISHNGQLVDRSNLRGGLIERGAIFQSTCDSETLAHLITQSKEDTIEEAIKSEMIKIPSAYSLIIMTKSKVVALRDAYGVRPLSIAKLDGGYLVASETTAFRIFNDAEFIRHIKPGEMVVFDKGTIQSGGKFESIQITNPKEHWCIFEGIYFSDPRSEYNGFMHEDFRALCGETVYQENKAYFDSLKPQFGDNVRVVPILDSGKQGARGFTKASGIVYREYFMRRHNAPKAGGRSYTAENQEARGLIAYMKLDLRGESVKGKVIITVDDSIVRATTARRNNKKLRDAGVEKIINVILSPPITDTCYLGMDHQMRDKLFAFSFQTEEERSKESGADKIIYLSSDGLNRIVSETYNVGICSGCFGGNYPV